MNHRLRHLLLLMIAIGVVLFTPALISAAEENDVSEAPDVVLSESASDDTLDGDDEFYDDDEGSSGDAAGECPEGGDHDWYITDITDDLDYQKVDEKYHCAMMYCRKCYEKKRSNQLSEHESYLINDSYKKIDGTYHQVIHTCSLCNSTYKGPTAKHKFFKESVSCNGTYHKTISFCDYCGYSKAGPLAKHIWDSSSVWCKKKATLTKKGVLQADCKVCPYEDMTRSVSWKRGTYYSASYDIVAFTNVYRKSKSITVWLANPAKGTVVKVKIGKKSYKATLKSNSKKVKIKIKKPKSYAKKITLGVYYKNKLIGVPDEYCVDDIETYDHVLYGKKIKKGMSKKKVRYLYGWGEPRRTASASGGKTIWYYYSGSYVVFKNGKVKRWYRSY